ncbi:fibronectin type III domain-containing protein [Leucobacter coleopterorum]|uniref:Fibronectin type III domain-containing protein n=1 Tax=Leucobacter coleopterorum TaxID=2714933 RepID=A0ABX6K0G9_9MICO|nr:fibronectin type III domain-containing protein [Leucobacter coleopterorum]QIM19358.1 fibronectin type III domain-containing protein [Leucobacter coleopterorum]
MSSDTVRYVAGKEAPWSDTCLISVRLVGQKAWTNLPVAINIAPRVPEAQLNALVRTVMPGASETIQLTDMVTWPGGREGDPSKLRFETEGNGSVFEVTKEGSRLKVAARADAAPGSQHVFSVSVSGAGESRAPLTVRVGDAPKDLPRGGSFALRCKVGSECGASVIGTAGEHDPFAGKSGGGLKLESVSTRSCKVGNFSRVGEAGVAVAWPADRVVGGTCTVGFTVIDAQGRTGTGSIEFDAAGVPEAPTSITQTAFDATSVTFSVTLGGQAHPEVTGAALSGPGSKTCTEKGPSSYQCVASGLVSGEKHSFSASAVNQVGSSAASTSVEAWAYKAPSLSSFTAVAVRNAANEDPQHGSVTLSYSGSDDVVSVAVVSNKGHELELSGKKGSQKLDGVEVGDITFTATPKSNVPLPGAGSGVTTVDSRQDNVTVMGAPRLDTVTLQSTGPHTAKLVFAGDVQGSEPTYGIKLKADGAPTCADAKSTSPDFANLARQLKYQAIVCVSSDWGRSSKLSNDETIGDPVAKPGGNLTYEINTAVSDQSADPKKAEYKVKREPAPELTDSATVLQYRRNGVNIPSFALDPGVWEQNIEVRQCINPAIEATCSEWAPITTAGPKTTVSLIASDTNCYNDANKPLTQADWESLITIPSFMRNSATITAGTPDATTIPITVTWKDDFQMLDDATVKLCYTPPPTGP